MSDPAAKQAVKVATAAAARALGAPAAELTVVEVVKRRRRSIDEVKAGGFYEIIVEAQTGTRLTFRVFDNGEVQSLGQ